MHCRQTGAETGRVAGSWSTHACCCGGPRIRVATGGGRIQAESDDVGVAQYVNCGRR
jgi:hypothetical protein